MNKSAALSIAGIGVLAAVLLALWARTWLSAPPSYLSFSRHRSQQYYIRFAEACDELIGRAKSSRDGRLHLAGDDPSLPSVLGDVKSTHVDVFSNRVNVFVNVAARYAIGWEQDDFNSKIWRLTVYGEAEPVTLLVKTNK